MKTLYLDIFSGLSGDMFIGALLDLGVEFQELERALLKLGLGGFQLKMVRAQKAGIQGVKFDVDLAPEPPGHGHVHSHPGQIESERGRYGGPFVNTSAGRVELSVFETNVPPRFRLYFYDERGRPTVPPRINPVLLQTIRPDGGRQTFEFKRQRGYLEAMTTLPEPHEFTAVLKLTHRRRAEQHEVAFIEEHHHHGHGHGRDSEPGHDHEHGHGHGRDFSGIRALIQNSQLSPWVKEKAVAVFSRIAAAEGKIHGHPPDKVHFHEVGAVDSIVDIVGACIALEMLGRPRVLAAPVVDGTGWIDCAHGRFPIPAPATVEILAARGVCISQSDEPHELITPTGAALLAEFAESFGPMHDLAPDRIGYGLGTRESKTRPNVLRAMLCDSAASVTTHDWETDTIITLQTNLDDINAEILGRFVEQALAAGALDVFFTPIQMKKNRPGTLLTVLCGLNDADKLTELILRETTAFGVRRFVTERRKLRREVVTVKTAFGDVAVKLGKLDGKVVQVAPEYESCKKAAGQAGVPLKQVYEAASKAL